MKFSLSLALVFGLALGCNAEPSPILDASTANDASTDAGDTADTGPGTDAAVDTGSIDAGGEDAATEDAATEDTAVADTWTNYAEGFMATYCVECHDGDTGAGRDFQVLAEVIAEQDKIRCGTSATTLDDCGVSPRAMQFPIGAGPLPSIAERDRFIAWIDAGLAE